MKRFILIVIALIFVGGLTWFGYQFFTIKDSKNIIPFQLAEVKKGEIFARVTTTGKVNPVLSVTVSTQVSGTIKKLPVDVNSKVKKGQLIARLDQDLFRAEVLQAQANLDDALANLTKEMAGVKMQKDQVDAGIAKAKASYRNLKEKYKRAATLYQHELISREKYDSLKAEWEVGASRLKESSARIDENKIKQANVMAAEARVKKAQAQLQFAQVKLNRSVISAPVSGTVILKNVEAGQTVAASLQSPPLVTIAELTTMKVEAWVDEADIGKVKVGQEVQFQVDSYPRRIFGGEVAKIYPSPERHSNVVTYDTEIHVENEDLALKPGMTANVTIILERKDNVLLVPHSAFKIRRRDLRKVYSGTIKKRKKKKKGALSQEQSYFSCKCPKRRAERARRRFLAGKGNVWLYRDGKPEKKRIRFGATDAQNVEILKGLKEGDKIIVGILASAVKMRSSSMGKRASRMRRRILGGF